MWSVQVCVWSVQVCVWSVQVCVCGQYRCVCNDGVSTDLSDSSDAALSICSKKILTFFRSLFLMIWFHCDFYFK